MEHEVSLCPVPQHGTYYLCLFMTCQNHLSVISWRPNFSVEPGVNLHVRDSFLPLKLANIKYRTELNWTDECTCDMMCGVRLKRRRRLQHGRKRPRRRGWITSHQFLTRLLPLIPMSRSIASVSRYCHVQCFQLVQLQQFSWTS